VHPARAYRFRAKLVQRGYSTLMGSHAETGHP
jgi:prolyl oligopeptidase PreP (S9A serine peptidase family)